ncbi:hypothetical protein [Pusillimonas sp.]|uniref:hypothetical protein n=1 Tax=Pusillimonas sp. TaxID=3040095 RepID=UPI0037C7B063
MSSNQRTDDPGPGSKRPQDKPASDEHFDEDNATRKSGRWGSEEPAYGEPEPARAHDSKRPNPQGPEYEEGGAYPGPSQDRNPGGSPESMRKPDSLGKPERHEASAQEPQKRTVGNRPADPNRMGADWNLLPPGISDEDAKDPGNMDTGKNRK